MVNLDSFDQSPLDVFVQSPLDARNGGLAPVEEDEDYPTSGNACFPSDASPVFFEVTLSGLSNTDFIYIIASRTEVAAFPGPADNRSFDASNGAYVTRKLSNNCVWQYFATGGRYVISRVIVSLSGPDLLIQIFWFSNGSIQAPNSQIEFELAAYSVPIVAFDPTVASTVPLLRRATSITHPFLLNIDDAMVPSEVQIKPSSGT